MTEFGRDVWVLAAKRGITNQRHLAAEVNEASSEAGASYAISSDTVRNYLIGRTSVSHHFLLALDRALVLTAQEKDDLAMVYAWGGTKQVSA